MKCQFQIRKGSKLFSLDYIGKEANSWKFLHSHILHRISVKSRWFQCEFEVSVRYEKMFTKCLEEEEEEGDDDDDDEIESET